MRHSSEIDTDGRLKWETPTGYGGLSLIETALGRYSSSSATPVSTLSSPATTLLAIREVIERHGILDQRCGVVGLKDSRVSASSRAN